MRTIPLVVVVSICLSGSALAQDTRRTELGVAYTVLHDQEPHGSAQGFLGSFAVNVNRWLGLIAEGGVNHGRIEDRANTHFDAASFMAGPRFSLRKSSRVTPFAQLLIGTQHKDIEDLTGDEGETSFAWQTGAGVEFRMNSRTGLTIGGDFRHIHEDAHHDNHHHSEFRFQTGVVFRVGPLLGVR